MRPIAAQLLVALPTAPTGLEHARVALSRASMSLDYSLTRNGPKQRAYHRAERGSLTLREERRGPAVGATMPGSSGFHPRDELRDFTAVYDSPNSPPRVTVASRSS